MSADASKPPQHREWHGTHHPWLYRQQAFRWLGPQVVGINFVPFAGGMRKWLQQRGQIGVLSTADYLEVGGYTNPYAISTSALTLIMARTVNAFHDYVTTPSPEQDGLDAEIERIRCYNEIVLYAARVCEAVIKQLLYCVHLPESRYKRMALGQRLESSCPACTKAKGKNPHQVSLVGTLAHPFHLCLKFERCAMDHMDLVNKLRNSQAAHSGIQVLNIRSVEESKAQLRKDGEDILSDFVHMLPHLEELEDRMLDDLADKGDAIVRLKLNGLPPEECNFRLIPGMPFVFEPGSEQRDG